jgi:hypothetical protein
MREESGWLHLSQSPAHNDPAVGERRLSVAAVDDGVTLVVSRDGVPYSCTIGWGDWDLLVHYVEDERDARRR